MRRLFLSLLAAAALAATLTGCEHDGTPAPAPTPAVAKTWPAPPESKKNGPQVELSLLPPPANGANCTSAEDPNPTGLTVSFGAITGLVYSACKFPEQPHTYTITLTLLAKYADGTYLPIKRQDYDEIPVWLPEKSPYSITFDCVPGTYALKMYVSGLDSAGKFFKAGPTQGGDFYVHEEDCP